MSDATPLSGAWDQLRRRHRTAFIPYLTAGYPDRATSLEALRLAAAVGDIVEVGVPFSDPLADGPIIQRSSFEALAGGMSLAGTLDLVARLDARRPVVLFSYLNPVLRYGVDRLLADAAAAGVSGLLLTDLPAGGDAAVEGAVAGSSLDLIRLVAPTSSVARIGEAVAGARGFIYLIGRLGVTGTSAAPAADLAASVGRVRAQTSLPVAVGFGVATARQAGVVARAADGVVVGSALVEALGQQGVAGLERLLGELRGAIDGEAA
ncbi:MAG TPA: tryptophan synthase subunit alpha [Gemmatimonadales bacterium]|nr:tryptophan synthase subunit alpha [Gemmatimonadales bacterium]